MFQDFTTQHEPGTVRRGVEIVDAALLVTHAGVLLREVFCDELSGEVCREHRNTEGGGKQARKAAFTTSDFVHRGCPGFSCCGEQTAVKTGHESAGNATALAAFVRQIPNDNASFG